MISQTELEITVPDRNLKFLLRKNKKLFFTIWESGYNKK